MQLLHYGDRSNVLHVNFGFLDGGSIIAKCIQQHYSSLDNGMPTEGVNKRDLKSCRFLKEGDDPVFSLEVAKHCILILWVTILYCLT